MPTKNLGRYEIVAVHARGAMGQVFEAFDPHLKRTVAIKTIRVDNFSDEQAHELEARFHMEMRAAGKLNHPNIISIFDAGRHDGMAYLVMEFVRGEDLKRQLSANIRFPLARVTDITRQLLSALNHAHERGVVHRDVKPGNIMIDTAGHLKLGDFGVARIAESGDLTQTHGSMVGTLRYMPPEQVRGEQVDARTDLFGAGVVLYELLTGQQPFGGANDFEVMQKIMLEVPAPPSKFDTSLPPEFDEVLNRALAKDRQERFASAKDFAVALRSAAQAAPRTRQAVSGSRPVGPGIQASGHAPAMPARQPKVDQPASPLGSTDKGVDPTFAHELELEYWREIKDSADPADLEEFLVKFRHGVLENLALRKLRRLRALAVDGLEGASDNGSSASAKPSLRPTSAAQVSREVFSLPKQPSPWSGGSASGPDEAFDDPNATNIAPIPARRVGQEGQETSGFVGRPSPSGQYEVDILIGSTEPSSDRGDEERSRTAEARIAEDKRRDEAARLAEAQRKADEARRAEEKRKAEEIRRAAERRSEQDAQRRIVELRSSERVQAVEDEFGQPGAEELARVHANDLLTAIRPAAQARVATGWGKLAAHWRAIGAFAAVALLGVAGLLMWPSNPSQQTDAGAQRAAESVTPPPVQAVAPATTTEPSTPAKATPASSGALTRGGPSASSNEGRLAKETVEKARNSDRPALGATIQQSLRVEARREAERARIMESARAEEERMAIERRQAAERKRAKLDAARTEESRLTEERRHADEKRQADERRVAEEARLAAERRKAEEIRLTEERRQAEERRRAEEARVAEERRKAADEAARKAADAPALPRPTGRPVIVPTF